MKAAADEKDDDSSGSNSSYGDLPELETVVPSQDAGDDSNLDPQLGADRQFSEFYSQVSW